MKQSKSVSIFDALYHESSQQQSNGGAIPTAIPPTVSSTHNSPSISSPSLTSLTLFDGAYGSSYDTSTHGNNGGGNSGGTKERSNSMSSSITLEQIQFNNSINNIGVDTSHNSNSNRERNIKYRINNNNGTTSSNALTNNVDSNNSNNGYDLKRSKSTPYFNLINNGNGNGNIGNVMNSTPSTTTPRTLLNGMGGTNQNNQIGPYMMDQPYPQLSPLLYKHLLRDGNGMITHTPISTPTITSSSTTTTMSLLNGYPITQTPPLSSHSFDISSNGSGGSGSHSISNHSNSHLGGGYNNNSHTVIHMEQYINRLELQLQHIMMEVEQMKKKILEMEDEQGKNAWGLRYSRRIVITSNLLLGVWVSISRIIMYISKQKKLKLLHFVAFGGGSSRVGRNHIVLLLLEAIANAGRKSWLFFVASFMLSRNAPWKRQSALVAATIYSLYLAFFPQYLPWTNYFNVFASLLYVTAAWSTSKSTRLKDIFKLL